ncbi:hypothetical protein U8V72_14920 [Priestia filamentosa]|uniref:hypothetical protein n=1 Tax=Priestia filamentosa TaxID=1402861 RepID=UPI00058905F0
MKRYVGMTLIGVASISALAACGNGDAVVKVGSENIYKEDVYKELVNRYGKDYLLGEIEYKLFIQNAKVTDNEVQEKVKVLEKENNVKTLKELAKQLGVSEEEATKRARSLAAQEKILIKEAKLTKEDIQRAFEERKYKMMVDYMVVDSKQQAQKIVNLVRNKKARDLETASHKVIETYYLNYKWNVELSEGLLDENVLSGTMGLEEGQVSDVIEKDGQYYIYQVKSRNTVELKDEKLEIVRELALEKGIDTNTILEKLKKKDKVEYKDEDIESLMK